MISWLVISSDSLRLTPRLRLVFKLTRRRPGPPAGTRRTRKGDQRAPGRDSPAGPAETPTAARNVEKVQVVDSDHDARLGIELVTQ
eukprot:649929-Rhodomonas_salina.1